MDGSIPFGTLTVVPDELRQFAALAPLATISPVSASVGTTPPLSGPMPESQAPDTHVRFSVEQTASVTLSAAEGIETLIQAALSFAGSYESTDETNAIGQRDLADMLGGSGAHPGLVSEGEPGAWKDRNQTDTFAYTNPGIAFPRNCWDRGTDAQA